MFILKILLLMAALQLHTQTDEPVKPTLLYLIPIVILSLFSGANIFHLLFVSIILGCVLLCYFLFLSRWKDGLPYYGIMIGGLVIILIGF